MREEGKERRGVKVGERQREEKEKIRERGKS